MELLNSLPALIGSILASVIAAFTITKSWQELNHFNKARRRTEYEFAKRLAEETNDPDLSRYSVELGYAALIGDSHLTHEQRKFLISLPESENTSRRFKNTRDLLTICTTPGIEGFQWKSQSYQNKRFRNLMLLFWICTWLICGISAFLPLLASSLLSYERNISNDIWLLQALAFIYFVPGMIWSAVNGRRLKDAEKIVIEYRHLKKPLLRVSTSQDETGQ